MTEGVTLRLDTDSQNKRPTFKSSANFSELQKKFASDMVNKIMASSSAITGAIGGQTKAEILDGAKFSDPNFNMDTFSSVLNGASVNVDYTYVGYSNLATFNAQQRAIKEYKEWEHKVRNQMFNFAENNNPIVTEKVFIPYDTRHDLFDKNYDGKPSDVGTIEKLNPSKVTIENGKFSDETSKYIAHQNNMMLISTKLKKDRMDNFWKGYYEIPKWKRDSMATYSYSKWNADYQEVVTIYNGMVSTHRNFFSDLFQKLAGVNGLGMSPFDADKLIRGSASDALSEDDLEDALEENYNNKIPSTCCLKYSCNSIDYRKEGEIYEESTQYQDDIKELQKYRESNLYKYNNLQSSKYTYEHINLDNFASTVKTVNSFLQNPTSFIMKSIYPYMEDLAFSNDWIQSFTVSGNEITIVLDLNELF